MVERSHPATGAIKFYDGTAVANRSTFRVCPESVERVQCSKLTAENSDRDCITHPTLLQLECVILERRAGSSASRVTEHLPRQIATLRRPSLNITRPLTIV